LDFIGDLDEEIGTVTLVVVGRDEVEEANKSESQVLGLRILQTLKNNLHDHFEVVLKSGPGENSVR
jgi:hypothetical protein